MLHLLRHTGIGIAQAGKSGHQGFGKDPCNHLCHLWDTKEQQVGQVTESILSKRRSLMQWTSEKDEIQMHKHKITA